MAILDTDDAERLLAELANLTRFVRLSALPPDDPDSIASDEIQALVRELGDSRFERRQLVLRRAGW